MCAFRARRFAAPAMAAAAAVGLTGAAVLLQPRPAAFTQEQKKKLPELHYFNIPGVAFPIRAALNHGKIEFEDVRHELASGDLAKMRGPEGSNAQVPLGQFPLFVLSDGHVACQSNSILRWAGKKSGLYPTDNDDEAQLVDEILDTAGEFFGKLPQSKDAAELKRLREEYIKGEFAKQMRYYSMRVEQLTSGPFLLGDKFSVADLKLAGVIAYVAGGKLDHLNAEQVKQYPAVWKHYEAVCAHPIYVEQMAREQKSMA